MQTINLPQGKSKFLPKDLKNLVQFILNVFIQQLHSRDCGNKMNMTKFNFVFTQIYINLLHESPAETILHVLTLLIFTVNFKEHAVIKFHRWENWARRDSGNFPRARSWYAAEPRLEPEHHGFSSQAVHHSTVFSLSPNTQPVRELQEKF